MPRRGEGIFTDYRASHKAINTGICWESWCPEAALLDETGPQDQIDARCALFALCKEIEGCAALQRAETVTESEAQHA